LAPFFGEDFFRERPEFFPIRAHPRWNSSEALRLRNAGDGLGCLHPLRMARLNDSEAAEVNASEKSRENFRLQNERGDLLDFM